jgi:hypothetical protein
VVDLLPDRLWRPGNLWTVFGHDLHFCVGVDGVRTVECDDRVLARGVLPFTAPPDEPSRLWDAVVPRVVDALPRRLWVPPGRAWLGGRVVFEVEHDETGGAQRVVDLWGRVGVLAGRRRQEESAGPQWDSGTSGNR